MRTTLRRALRHTPRPLRPPPLHHHHRPLHTTAPNPHSSVNPSEVSHFNALASTWWDAHGSSRILHLMNPLRHDFIASCLATSPPPPAAGLRYLDVGCGGGIFAESAARLPTTHSVTAVDPTPNILAVARQHAAQDPSLTAEKLRYLAATIETLGAVLPAGAPTQFDVVTCFEVVEHVDHAAAFLDRCGAAVRPGGWLVLSTIARTWTSWLTTKVVAEDVLGVVPRGTHDWHKYVNEGELRAHFAEGEGNHGRWGPAVVRGVVYVPGLGWREVRGSEKVGNYFFAVQRLV